MNNILSSLNLDCPKALPIHQKWQEISSLIAKHQVVIVAGETGSGKTTQLPKICLSLGLGIKGIIGHTQPRRLAASAVAGRIAEECGTSLGDLVGFKVRFSDHISPQTRVKLMTDGILLAEMQGDRLLNQYDALIIDEAHERSLNIDFILGYLKRLLPKRPDLKIIITSATIDLKRFSEHFNYAPVVEVSGRTYPVEVRYRPWQEVKKIEEEVEGDLFSAISQVVAEIDKEERNDKRSPGDILVFLPGEREIRDLAKTLREDDFHNTEILPLYARLSRSEQKRIFQSHHGRRIILSTNVAETSLTVPGIRYVIDTGMARISRYSYRTKIQRLPVEAISQASANQRKGRCGRISDGICYRMYSEEDFIGREEFTDPEILRTNLASVILKMETLKLGSLDQFPFLERPDNRLINDGYKLLFELKGVNKQRQLTATGRILSKIPVDPKLARMIVEAQKEHSLREVLIIAAALSIQDPRERPADKTQAADQKHADYKHEKSDFLFWVMLWDSFEKQRQALSGNQLKKYCKKQFLSFLKMREWRELHRQLHLVIKTLNFTENQQPAHYDQVHRAVLSGFLGGIGMQDEKRLYRGGRNRVLNLFPGSALYKKPPKWMVSSEIVETRKIFARMNAQIEPEWVESLATHLVKRHFSEPHWEKKRGQVVAFERVSLYGLDVIAKRKIHYARVDSVMSREIFIRQALVEGEFSTKAPFWQKNRLAIEQVHELEARARRRDILIEDEALFQFYHRLIPEQVISAGHFEHWWKELSKQDMSALFLTQDDLIAKRADSVNTLNYPDFLDTNGLRLPLQYHFEPGQSGDGVSLKVPVSALKQVSQEQLEWLVPGMIREKCIQLIKHLPRQYRKQFVPVPDFVDSFIPTLRAEDNIPLTESLSKALLRKKSIKIPPECWDKSKVEDYLSFNIQVVDSKGKILSESRSLTDLLEKFSSNEWASHHHFDKALPAIESYTQWENLELPEVVIVTQAGVEMPLYPALKDAGDHVEKIFCHDSVSAQLQHRKGVARLVLLTVLLPISNLEKTLPSFKKSALLYAPLGRSEQLRDDLLLSVVQRCFLQGDELPRNKNQFDDCVSAGKASFYQTIIDQTDHLLLILQAYNSVIKKLKGKISLELAPFMSDLKFQIEHLVFPGFMLQTPIDWLSQYPRYLKACDIRLEKMPRNIVQEREVAPVLRKNRENYDGMQHQLLAQGKASPELELYRWMIEEWRVSIFAQQLGTRMTVSHQRLEKQWKTIKVRG